MGAIDERLQPRRGSSPPSRRATRRAALRAIALLLVALVAGAAIRRMRAAPATDARPGAGSRDATAGVAAAPVPSIAAAPTRIRDEEVGVPDAPVRIGGRVVSAWSGGPIRARVQAGEATAWTDRADGGFSIEARAAEIAVAAAGFRRRSLAVPRGSAFDVGEIALEPDAEVAIAVLDARSAPFAGARVLAERTRDGAPAAVELGMSGADGVVTARVDRGSIVRAETAGMRSERAVVAGERVELHVARSRRRLRLLDGATGGPAADVALFVTERGSWPTTRVLARSDADGFAGEVASGPLRLELDGSDWTFSVGTGDPTETLFELHPDVAASSEPLTLTLARSLGRWLRVVDATSDAPLDILAEWTRRPLGPRDAWFPSRAPPPRKHAGGRVFVVDALRRVDDDAELCIGADGHEFVALAGAALRELPDESLLRLAPAKRRTLRVRSTTPFARSAKLALLEARSGRILAQAPAPSEGAPPLAFFWSIGDVAILLHGQEVARIQESEIAAREDLEVELPATRVIRVPMAAGDGAGVVCRTMADEFIDPVVGARELQFRGLVAGSYELAPRDAFLEPRWPFSGKDAAIVEATVRDADVVVEWNRDWSGTPLLRGRALFPGVRPERCFAGVTFARSGRAISVDGLMKRALSRDDGFVFEELAGAPTALLIGCVDASGNELVLAAGAPDQPIRVGCGRLEVAARGLPDAARILASFVVPLDGVNVVVGTRAAARGSAAEGVEFECVPDTVQTIEVETSGRSVTVPVRIVAGETTHVTAGF